MPTGLKRFRRHHLGIGGRLVLLHLLVLSVLTVILGSIQVLYLYRDIRRDLGATALNTSQLVAELPVVIQAAKLRQPSEQLNEKVLSVRTRVKADYVVVGDRLGVRLAHQIPELIGQRIVSRGVEEVLAGLEQVTIAQGASGVSLRARVPILDEQGRVIGLVSTGYYLPRVDALAQRAARQLLPWFLLALIIGTVGAVLVARRLKREILNLEPEQISMLVRQQRGVLAALPEGVIAVDRNGAIVLANERAHQLLKLDDHGFPYPAVSAWPELAGFASTVTRHRNVELRLRNRPVLVNLEPLEDDGFVVSIRDRREVMVLAEELTQVKGFVEVLRAQTHEYTNRLHTISGLLQLGHPEDALRVLDAEIEADHEFRDLLRDLQSPRLAALLVGKRQRAQELGIDFRVEPGSNLSDRWERTTDALVTILGNFTENAFEALRGRKGGVRVYIGEDPEGIQVEVHDDGQGVMPEIASRLFEQGVSTKGPDRGYGLNLVRERVEALGGDVRHFRRGPWTVFQANLPANATGEENVGVSW